ncbi:hypothetical protein MASR2M47_03090 [Draconibacterium sp.]
MLDNDMFSKFMFNIFINDEFSYFFVEVRCFVETVADGLWLEICDFILYPTEIILLRQKYFSGAC